MLDAITGRNVFLATMIQFCLIVAIFTGTWLHLALIFKAILGAGVIFVTSWYESTQLDTLYEDELLIDRFALLNLLVDHILVFLIIFVLVLIF